MEVGVLEGFGIDKALGEEMIESPFGGTVEFGGALGEEHLGGRIMVPSFCSPPFLAFSSIIPLILSISATLSRAGSSS